MMRRWKVGIALAVVGIGGFLVWAFRSPATPLLTIRFSGYMTNDASTPMVTLPPGDGSIFAVFAVTNHRGHALVMVADSTGPASAGLTNQAAVWTDATNEARGWGEGLPLIPSGEGALFGARVLTTDKPIQMTVAGLRDINIGTSWGRFRAKMSWNMTSLSATATNELR